MYHRQCVCTAVKRGEASAPPPRRRGLLCRVLGPRSRRARCDFEAEAVARHRMQLTRPSLYNVAIFAICSVPSWCQTAPRRWHAAYPVSADETRRGGRGGGRRCHGSWPRLGCDGSASGWNGALHGLFDVVGRRVPGVIDPGRGPVTCPRASGVGAVEEVSVFGRTRNIPLRSLRLYTFSWTLCGINVRCSSSFVFVLLY